MRITAGWMMAWTELWETVARHRCLCGAYHFVPYVPYNYYDLAA